MSYIYLDTETTGFKPGQIAQLSYIEEDGGRIVGADNLYFKVDNMPEETEKVHGLSTDKLVELSGGQVFSDRADELYSKFKDATMIAHNSNFDLKFLSAEFWRCGVMYSPAATIDTMKIFTPILKLPRRNYSGPSKEVYKFPNLGEVGNYYGISDKIALMFANRVYGCKEGIGLHDSRFDTSIMFLATMLYREDLSGGNAWHTLVDNNR